jgi:putative transposase
VGEKRVARLMREARLRARIVRVYKRQPGLHRFYAKTPNLRLNQPPPSRIDQVWVGDITYLRVGRAWRYLAAVMDLYSRRLLGWALGRSKSMKLTMRALERAISARGTAHGLMFYSDRGVEYGSEGELIAVLSGYIDRVRRLHSSLGYHTPVEFDQLMSS